MRGWILTCTVLVALASSAWATDRYVATNGSDSNSGTIGSPWLTCNKVKASIVAGDHVFFRAGTYASCSFSGDDIPSGTGATGRTVISAMPISRTCSGYNLSRTQYATCDDSTYEPVTLNGGFLFEGGYEWIVLEGFTVDRRRSAAYGIQFYHDGGLPTNEPDCTTPPLDLSKAARDIQVFNVTVKNSARSGFGSGSYNQRIDLSNVTARDNGDFSIGYHHGAYWSCTDSFVRGSRFIHNANIGAQFYFNISLGPCQPISTGIVVDGNVFTENSSGAYIGGGTSGVVFKNNLIYGNTNTGLTVGSYRLSNPHKVYNSTMLHNGKNGLDIGENGDNAVIKNNIYDKLKINVGATGMVFENNYGISLTNPTPDFVNPDTGDYRLVSGDARINAGQNLAGVGVTQDFFGVTRPQGGAFDLGYSEFVSGTPSFNYTMTSDVIEEEDTTVVQGQSVQVGLTVTALAGTATTVTFSAQGLPSGATASFSPASCTPVTPCISTMTIQTSNGTPEGGFTVVVRGTAGALVRTTDVPLIVTCQAGG